MAETADKNMIDKDEYPQTAEIEARCVNILADLWHARAASTATGCSTTGSSEAVMLGGLALKWRWRERMRAAGRRPTGRTSSPAPTSRSAGRSSAATGTSSRGWCRWRASATTSAPRGRRAATRTRSASRDPRLDLRRQLRAGQGDRRGARRARARHRDRRPDPCRRGLRRLRRAVPPTRARVGLPHPARPVDQRLRPQVRTRLSGRRLGDLARRRGAAEGPDLRRQLPRRPHADLRAQLLAPRAAR
jgi:hypothetical protein